jgi:hypothetical protein
MADGKVAGKRDFIEMRIFVHIRQREAEAGGTLGISGIPVSAVGAGGRGFTGVGISRSGPSVGIGGGACGLQSGPQARSASRAVRRTREEGSSGHPSSLSL